MKLNQHSILERIKKIVTDRNPAAKIYLYGSRARATMKEDSDWDLLILLNKDSITSEDERQITYPLYDLEFEVGEVISPIIYSEMEWNTKHRITPFYANVMREGKLL
jgi:predicted nucleotidyltransferase